MQLFAIGSPQTGDDISWLVVEQIEATLLDTCPGLQIHYLDRPGMQLVNEFKNQEGIIIVDALLDEASPGKIQQIQSDNLLCNTNALSSHDFSVANALILAKKLGSYPEHLWLYGISSNTNNCSFDLQLVSCFEKQTPQRKVISTY